MHKGYSVRPSALPESVSSALSDKRSRLNRREFRKGGIGRGQYAKKNQFVRNNKINWIEDSDPDLAHWHQWNEQLRRHLNRELFLGLFSFESHFTLYEAGDRYKRHIDAFAGERSRVVSLVSYLNEGWQPDQGGELVLYPKDNEPIFVTPAFGTLVLFLSEEMPHEVLPTKRKRHGIAGWFRINGSVNNQIDPPQ